MKSILFEYFVFLYKYHGRILGKEHGNQKKQPCLYRAAKKVEKVLTHWMVAARRVTFGVINCEKQAFTINPRLAKGLALCTPTIF